MGNNNSYYLVPGSELNAIADAIRSKTGNDVTYSYVNADYRAMNETPNLQWGQTCTISLHAHYEGASCPTPTEAPFAVGDLFAMDILVEKIIYDPDMTWTSTYTLDQLAYGSVVSVESWNYVDEYNATIVFTVEVLFPEQPSDTIDFSADYTNTTVLSYFKGTSTSKHYTVNEMAPAIQSISANSSSIPTSRLLIYNATIIQQQNIPYIREGQLCWSYGYEDMYSLVGSDGTTVELDVPTGAIIMIKGDNHSVVFGNENFIEVTSEMNLLHIEQGMHWYKITGEVELSASW